MDFKGRTVDNIVMKVYEQDDPTCGRLHADYPAIIAKDRKEYMVAQYLPEQKCTTITLTQPYQSILGNIITRDRFPSFNEGMYIIDSIELLRALVLVIIPFFLFSFLFLP